eukprot:TRINITY_DN73680_c0_g1_i1.p1 TRINITY_DN73680_c0_g1~~TRINITY_DN73680_c0_g1_i1.p1  ORF type:complete len:189 (-),score=39.24 TRINITY_DN73680_c0_g1_i1:99-665(-)
MFSCRFCSDSPFSTLFGGADPEEKSHDADVEKRRRNRNKPAAASSDASRRNERTFQPRDAEGIQALVEEWMQYTHPRALELFQTEEKLRSVLTSLARGVNKTDDPVLGPDDQCVFWYGDVTREDREAALVLVKPGETVESVTYVNRILAFAFATDESFNQLMTLPKRPFRMTCSDQLCVQIAHISMSM